jgi:hypothetical protein
LEVYTPDGSLVCRVYMTERDLPVATPNAPAEKSHPEKSKEKEPANGEPMTSPQKRLLFRLMATQGKEGETAHEELKKKFRVKSLQDVSKREASRMIEQLMETQGGNGHGSSL